MTDISDGAFYQMLAAAGGAPGAVAGAGATAASDGTEAVRCGPIFVVGPFASSRATAVCCKELNVVRDCMYLDPFLGTCRTDSKCERITLVAFSIAFWSRDLV